jgi:predicted membrane channel-forming protein YqfA (hemolysin III family)
MLSPEEEKFLLYWKQNREKERSSIRPFLVGMSGGFAIGATIMIVLSSGWYERANMEANSRLSAIVFLLAILVISFFLAFFYRKFRWETMEQRYLELLARKNKNKIQNPTG